MPNNERRGGSRRGGGGGGGSREVTISKKLSWLLRHGAKQEGLTIDKKGYVNVADVLSNKTIRPLKVSLDELRKIVADNAKQRFSLIPDPAKWDPSATAEVNDGDDDAVVQPSLASDFDASDPAGYLIRANQGHSIPVDLSELLKPITTDNLPKDCCHGTTRQAWPKIVASGGLKKMTRTHIHFAAGLPKGFVKAANTVDGSGETQERPKSDGTAEAAQSDVISGMRLSSTVLVWVDMAKAMAEGIPFWLSENGVVLSEGNEEGILETRFFRKVEEIKRGASGFEVKAVLVNDGIVL